MPANIKKNQTMYMSSSLWLIEYVAIEYIDAGRWGEDTYTFWGQKVKVAADLCQNFGSHMFHEVISSHSFYILYKDRCKMVGRRHLYILGVKSKGHTWPLSTL